MHTIKLKTNEKIQLATRGNKLALNHFDLFKSGSRTRDHKQVRELNMFDSLTSNNTVYNESK